MNSGIYTACSGLRAQMEALDMLANNLANLGTTGFKEQKAFFSVMNETLGSSESPALDAAVNNHVMLSEGAPNFQDGSLVETGRDLDIALVGNGLLTVETPNGVRYTRNGGLVRDANSFLATHEGYPVLGERGKIMLGPGRININEQGEVFAGDVRVDRLKLAAFGDASTLKREGDSLFAAAVGQAPGAAPAAVVRQGFLEQSNVNPVLATVRMMEIMRNFESIQKSLNLMINEMDAKSIEKLPRF